MRGLYAPVSGEIPIFREHFSQISLKGKRYFRFIIRNGALQAGQVPSPDNIRAEVLNREREIKIVIIRPIGTRKI